MIELYPHQKEALNKLRNGSILRGGVGSGKSITSLAYFFIKVCDGNPFNGSYRPPSRPKNLYILTTAQKRDNGEWDEELSNFLLSRNVQSSICSIKVTVDSWNNIKKYTDVKDSFFIFDEQKVSGHGAWTKAFLKITQNNQWILLSATPGDKWEDYITVFIAHGFYRNKTEFERKHCVFKPYVKYKDIDHYIGEELLEKYKSYITVYMDSPITKQHIVKNVPIPYSKEDYKFVLKNRWNVFSDSPIRNASELCQVLRRVVQNPEYRLEQLIILFKEYKRLIVFYNFDYELEVLKSLTSYPIYEYNGHKHEAIPDSEEWIYCVQYNSGSEAWNCIKTNVVVFYSLNYSYRTMKQSSGRIDRLNSPYDNLYYYIFRTYSGIDLGIMKALRDKKTFNETKYSREMEFVEKKQTIMERKG